MIQIKLLISPQEYKYQEKDERFKEFLELLNKEWDKHIEIVHEKESNFSGYYLFFESNYFPDKDYKLIDQKTFLINVSHHNDDVIKDCNPSGYITLRNYMVKNPLIFGLNKVLQYANMDNRGLKYFDYCSLALFKKDGTYKPMVKSIIEYLEAYDAYLNSK
ncbi:hypothetical protein [uncultured Psychroserpens sp.]|uniref:hypothetical protein n=1 Tax=uncultured Psychroserpens sp. TaxID=255436 RepID=UPI002622E784|nr:hypothetical protein [uncultured Psychroserpens sp.]